MSNNFRSNNTTTYVYCNQSSGSDLNDGYTPDTPVATLNAARLRMNGIRSTLVATGYFLNEIFGIITTNCNIIADGKFIIDYVNTAIFMNNALYINMVLSGIQFRNLSNPAISSVNYSYITYYYCTFYNCLLSYDTNSVITEINSNIFINSILTSSVRSIPLTSNKFFNSNITSLNVSILNNHFNEGCTLNLPTVFTASNFVNNNVRCAITKLTVGYYATVNAAISASIIIASNINVDPMFNSAENMDFTVNPSSPMLTYLGGVIGNVKPGVGVYFSGLVRGVDYDISVTGGTDDLIINSGDIYLAGGKTSGIITFLKSINLGAKKSINQINYLGKIFFNSGSISNVPKVNSYPPRTFQSYSAYAAGTTYVIGDKVNYTIASITRVYNSLQNSNTGNTPSTADTAYWQIIQPSILTNNVAGNNPNRLTVEIKYGDTDTGWNDRNYVNVDLNEKPRFDNIVGNGDPTFDNTISSVVGGISAQYILPRITLRSIL